MTAMPVSTAATTAAVRMRGISKRYVTPAGTFIALRDVDLDVGRGEFVAVVGPSGSGKSTLLNLVGGIDRADAGEIVVSGEALRGLRESELSRWRGRGVGIVFQFFQLLPTLSVLENVVLPMDLAPRWPARERRERARALLARMHVDAHADKLPSALSGGQQQRVAVARALANAPPLLLADEPTGNLDEASAASLLDLFAELVADGLTVLMVTHERAAIRRAARVIALADGAVVDAEVARHRNATVHASE
jgi:putative ABC transport system ATP-binding protein